MLPPSHAGQSSHSFGQNPHLQTCCDSPTQGSVHTPPDQNDGLTPPQVRGGTVNPTRANFKLARVILTSVDHLSQGIWGGFGAQNGWETGCSLGEWCHPSQRPWGGRWCSSGLTPGPQFGRPLPHTHTHTHTHNTPKGWSASSCDRVQRLSGMRFVVGLGLRLR